MKLVLATDGSPCSQAAEKFLASFPFRQPPNVHVITVCPVADLHPLAASIPEGVNKMVEQCRENAKQLLEQTAEQCQSWASEVETTLLDGHPAAAILEFIDLEQPDLITVGARGLGALRRFLLGSVSERVAKHARSSVLVVRSDHEESKISARKILIADDGSEASARSIERFAQLPLGEDREVYLLSVMVTMPSYGMEAVLESEPEWEQHASEIKATLQQHAENMKQATPHVQVMVHKSSDPANDILDTAESSGIDLIVAGGTGKGNWERLLLGSTSLRILHHAPCSVWIERGSAN